MYLWIPAKLTMSILSIEVKSDEYVPININKFTLEYLFGQMYHLKSLNIDPVRYPFEQSIHDMKVNYQNISINRIFFL